MSAIKAWNSPSWHFPCAWLSLSSTAARWATRWGVHAWKLLDPFGSMRRMMKTQKHVVVSQCGGEPTGEDVTNLTLAGVR